MYLSARVARLSIFFGDFVIMEGEFDDFSSLGVKIDRDYSIVEGTRPKCAGTAELYVRCELENCLKSSRDQWERLVRSGIGAKKNSLAAWWLMIIRLKLFYALCLILKPTSSTRWVPENMILNYLGNLTELRISFLTFTLLFTTEGLELLKRVDNVRKNYN